MEPARRFAILKAAKKEVPIYHLYNRTIKDNPPPVVEPRLSIGFEVNTEPKLLKLLYDPSVEKRLQSLFLLYEHCSNHEKIIRVVEFNGLDPLVSLLFDENEMIRQRSAALLSRISVIHFGAKSILQHSKAFEEVLKILSDQHQQICVSVHSIINHICSSILVEEAVNRNVIPVLIKSLTAICDEAKAIALDSLNYCAERLETSIHIALQEGVVPILNDIFKNVESVSNPIVIEKAASLLAVLCGHVDGKKDAIVNDAVAPLADILTRTEDVHIQTIVTECLMTILSDLEGQRLALRVNFCATLMTLLEKDNLTLRLNTITAISNMAINPQGRELLQPCLETLHLLQNHQDYLIRESAQEAIARVEWKA